MAAGSIETARPTLVPATTRLLEAELERFDLFSSALSADLPADWPPRDGEYDLAAMRFFLERLTAGGPAAIGWYGWYAIRRGGAGQLAILVACGGYFGPPDAEGSVEIGYSVSAAWRRRGIATELVAALVANANAHSCVRRVFARTAPGNAASLAVLLRNGFVETDCDEPDLLRFVRIRARSER
jgi:RimJ/RimL family protein N-acetyltransferase